jgi:4-amino-4-deoxy-L-arabinose transferase-like glycosyltransferase
MAGPDPLAPNPSRVVLEALALGLLWAALYLPNLGKPEYENEEGRRVIPAREMAQAGDHVLPTIFGRPYIAKPPAFYWAIDLVGALRGGIDETSARLPAALATLACAWSVLAFAARFLAWPAARLAALLFLLTPLVLEKGTLAEIEPFLGATVFGASALAWIGSRGSRGSLAATLAAVPLLALAVLAKGPAAWVFFAAMLLAAALVERSRAKSVLLTGALVLAASTALAGIWLALLVRDLGWARLSATWAGEVTGGAKGPSYLAERLRFVSRSLGAFGLGTLLALLALVDRRSRWLEPLPVRIALGTSALGFAFFLVFPRAQARYLYPLAPWMALLAGHVLARACDPAAPRAAVALVRGLVLAIGAAGVLVPLVVLASRAGWLELPLELGATALALAAVLGVLAAAALALVRRSPRKALALALGVLALGRASQLLVVGPRVSAHERRGSAARIDRAVPAGVTLHAALWSEFNLLAYVAHPLVWVEDPLALEPGETAVFVEDGARPAPPADWLVLDRIPLEPPRSLVVASRLAPPGGAR